MDFMLWIWLGVIVLVLIIEFFTLDMSAIWFAVGAVPALIMAAVGGVHWGIQLGVFAAVSIVLLLCLRKITKKYILQRTEKTANVVGTETKLLSPIGLDFAGVVKVNGILWNAKSSEPEELDEGVKVRVIKIDGNQLIVEKIQENHQNDKEKEVDHDKTR